jgi:hypothetical protein
MRIADRPSSALWFGGTVALLAALGCATDPPAGVTRNQGTGTCPPGAMSCGGVCTDVNSSSNCGGCGQACGAGLVCSQGACAVTCGPGLTLCGTSCVSGPCGGNVPFAGNGSTTGGGAGQGAGGSLVPGAGNGGNVGGAAAAGVTGGMSGGGQGGAGGVPAGEIGGYIESGAWRGFAWTATSPNGGTIMPADFAAAFDFPLCAKGSVMPGDSNVAMVGWNINQSSVDGEPPLTVSPSLAGITVSIDNPGGSELRLQVQGPNGESDPNDRWCAVIPGTGGFIPFDAFNTECWSGGMGMPYMGQPLVAAIVLVPGKMGMPVSFDFCITELVETDENGMASTGCSLSGGSGEGSGTISGSDTRVVTRDGRQYVVQNNVWNGNGNNQSLTLSGVAFTVSSQGNSAGTGGPPTSYPSVFIGSNFGHSTSGSGLPRQVSALSSVQTGWRWSGGNGTYNAAYDVWFSSGAGGDSGTPSGGYLMVWFARAGVQPLGSPSGTVSIGGRSWQVWTCPGGCQNGVPVISYIPPSGSISEWSFDLNDFIQNAVEQFGIIQSSWYLSNVFAGFELWSGGQGMRSENFCAVVR